MAAIGVSPLVLRARIDSAVRYSPAGQPSVLALIAAMSASGRSTPCGPEQLGGVPVVELEVAGLDQGPAPASQDARERQAARRPTGQDHLRSTREVAREGDQHIRGVGPGEAVDVVEDQHEGAWPLGERRAEAWNRGAPDRRPRGRERFGDIGAERRCASECEGDV